MIERDVMALKKLKSALEKFLSASDRNTGWDRYQFKWPKGLATTLLSDIELDALVTTLLIEDHLPAYAKGYMERFPVDTTVSFDQAWWNRHVMHFIPRWIAEEDRHAHVLWLYLTRAQLVDEQELKARMIEEGVKEWHAPQNHFQLFVYTTVQEMATALYYRCLHDNISEPVLRAILKILAGEEARHGTFFGDLVKIYLDSEGEDLIGYMENVFKNFEMPLSSTLDKYFRHAVNMRKAAGGYDYRKAFIQFKNMVERRITLTYGSPSERWQEFFSAISQLGPNKKRLKRIIA